MWNRVAYSYPMANAWLWWLALAAALPLLAAPLLLTIRRSGRDRVPFFGRRASVRPPWWTHLLMLPGLILLFAGALGLGGPEDGWRYVAGAAVVSLALTTGLVLWHNRRAMSDPSGQGEGVRQKPGIRS